MESTDIKVVPEFNSEMEIIAIEVSCDNEGVLNLMDRDRLQELLNKELGEQYSINVEVKESQFQELQDNGKVRIAVETETIITESNSVLLDEGDVELGENVTSERRSVFNSSGYSIAKKVNKKAYEILLPYLQNGYWITSAIITRGMSSYKSWSYIEKDGSVWTENECLTPAEIHLLDKISLDVTLNSTGVDSRNVVSIIKQYKNDDLFLQMEVEFNDGNILCKYKLEKKETFKERYIDISF